MTIQRQLSRKVTLELGYIGRRITHEYQPINLNAVPYMMTMGGQQFAQAYKNVVLQYCGGIAGLAGGGCAANAAAVTPQPFFEAALATQHGILHTGLPVAPPPWWTTKAVASTGGEPQRHCALQCSSVEPVERFGQRRRSTSRTA